MSGFRGNRRFLSLAVMAIGLVPAAAWADTIPYDLTIDTVLDVKLPGQPKPRPTQARPGLHFQVDRKDMLEDVVVNSLEVLISSDGRTLMNSRLNRQGASFQQGSKEETQIAAEQATDSLKQLLDQFGTPVARITLDSEGSEQAREILVDKDSVLVENGVIDNTQFFLVRFPDKEAEWESKVRLSIGNGQYAQGTLRYKK